MERFAHMSLVFAAGFGLVMLAATGDWGTAIWAGVAFVAASSTLVMYHRMVMWRELARLTHGVATMALARIQYVDPDAAPDMPPVPPFPGDA